MEDHWLTTGSYCPIGSDNLRGMVYEKEGVNEAESIYLAKYLSARDGSSDCTNGDMVLRRASENR